MKVFTATLLFALFASSFGFWSTGHMIIAKIAENELMNDHPDIYKMIDSDIKELSKYSKESKHPFVESSTWADDNKGVAWGAFNGWHFVDNPVVEEGFTGETDMEPNNATWAAGQTVRTLKDERKHSMDDHLARSFMARYLVHLVGDIHQPLHAAAYYSKQFPHGDRGGNSWKVSYNKEIDNLHKLWDSCVDQYGSVWTPMKDSEWDMVSDVAKDLVSKFSREVVKEKVALKKFEQWADESNEIAKKYVYAGINPGDKPSEEYIETGRKVINESLAVGGYRLADIIVDSYKNHKGLTQTLMERN